MARAVVISGLGPISGLGQGMEPTWEAVLAGRSSVGPIQLFDPAGFDCRIAAEVSDFSIRKYVPKSYRKAIKVMARDIELSVAAADFAARDGGLATHGTDPDADPSYDPTRVGCHIGAGLIAADLDELTLAMAEARVAEGPGAGDFDIHQWGKEGITHLTPLWLLKYLPNMLSCHVSIIHDTQGASNTITCGEASAGLSVIESIRVIQRGAADICFSGGVESKLNPMGFLRHEFSGRLISTANQEPAGAVRPLCKNAAGTVVGEGGGIVMLEAVDTFQKRRNSAGDDVRAYAQIVGYGASQSVNPERRNLAPHEDGKGVAVAIRQSLNSAGIEPAQVNLIVPIGLGTLESDRAEAAALRLIFGDALGDIPIATLKSMVGNCGAGAGGVDLCIAAKAIAEQTIPAVINCDEPLDGLACGTAPSRASDLQYVLTFSGGQGGQIAALVLKRFDD